MKSNDLIAFQLLKKILTEGRWADLNQNGDDAWIVLDETIDLTLEEFELVRELQR